MGVAHMESDPYQLGGSSPRCGSCQVSEQSPTGMAAWAALGAELPQASVAFACGGTKTPSPAATPTTESSETAEAGSELMKMVIAKDTDL